MSDQEEEQQPPTHPPQPPQPGHVKLAVFRPQVPALWFEQAECAFPIKHVDAQFDHYCHVVSALTHKFLCLIADLVESEPSATPYNLWPRKSKIVCPTPFNLDFSMCLGIERTFSYLGVATIMDALGVLHEQHTLYSCVQQIWFCPCHTL
jgi:hypothetical protein